MTDICPQYNYSQRAILGVCGYLRDVLKQSETERMPYDLVQLITVWFGISDYFDIENSNRCYQLRPAQNAMKRVFPAYNGICYQLYGSLNIQKGDIKIWKLQILSVDPICPTATTLIGIIPRKKMDANLMGDFCDRECGGYGISCVLGRKYFSRMQGFNYAEPIQVNDIIIMELNMIKPEDCTLKYKVCRNGITTDHGFAFRKINPNYEWRLAIGMYYRESIRLLR